MLTYAPNGTLYTSLRFGAGTTADPFAYAIQRYDGTAWTAVATFDTSPTALTFAPNGDLYVFGTFTTIDGAARRDGPVARFDGTAWSSLSPALPPLVNSARLRDLVFLPSGTYALGEFDNPYGGLFVYVLRLVGDEWRTVGSGVSTAVSALTANPADGTVYAGWSDFKSRGVAHWDGQTWQAEAPMPTCANDCDVRGLAFGSDGKLYASGFLSTLSGFGRLDPAGWARLGTGATVAGGQMVREPSGSVLFMNAGGGLTSHTGFLYRFVPGASGPVSQSGNQGSITASGYAYAPDGTLYATAGATSFLHRWNDG